MVGVVCFTAGNQEEAEQITEALVKEKLVACANMFPVKSIYWWKDGIAKDDEVFVWMKTKAENFEKIVERVRELHSYELPVIEMIDSKTFPEVEKWVERYVK